MINRREILVMEKLGLEYTEEILHNTVIVTIAFSGHALPDPFIL